ncbi:glycosyltransferase family protein [Phenylobacterium sp.]|uniref:glycosyltransferase family protein n=1 Tax=Phenylobacterium sp. TaxID=1871053 RepID=UPI002733FA35|nr:glycosyltransferase family protein [Phenylobacterium sp.]MDP3634937.1 glycosyltransferase family protein [Phenylobacterium sp.]MDZ4052836.1 glycosyltransferase family protein [Phenylobacterium sp.]
MILGIIQARMSSTRLPGKVLADVAGMPMLGRQVERLRRSRRMDELVLATSDQASDDAVADYAARLDLTVVRGDLDDVLGRFGRALDAFPEAATVVRMTADCPLTDWRVLDAVIAHHAATRADYASNTPEVRTYPHGLDIEVMTAAALRTALFEATDPYDREHVTPFLYRNPRRFRIESLSQSPSLAHLRWTVDHPQDLDFVRHVYGTLHAANPDFGMAEIAALEWNSSKAV